MNVTYSLIIGLFVIILVLAAVNFFTIIRVVKLLIEYLKHVKEARSLPSPPGRWFWGHALDLTFTHDDLMKWMDYQRKFDGCCAYWIGPIIPWIIISDIEIVKKLLHQPGETRKPYTFKYIRNWLGDGLETGDGEKWKRHRKMLTPAFHFDILKQYIPVYNEVCDSLLKIWSPSADSGESVDICKNLNCYTLDVLLRCIYSNYSNCLEERENATYLVAVEGLMELFTERGLTPHYYFDFIYYSTASGRKCRKYCDDVHNFSDSVIMQRRKELLQKTQQPNKKYKDFLDILLSVKDENGVGLTDTEIREEVDTFMFGGHETTANVLIWTMYCMAKYQEHQDLCREEVREVLAGRDSDDILWEDLSKLNYTAMCIKEVMRMYPVVTILNRMSSDDIVTDKYKIPKGSWVGVGVYFIHHNPSLWTDPEKFDPMRFSPENSKNLEPFAFLTFAAGLRNCIGQRFALQELKVTVARIINRYKIELDPAHKIDTHFVGTVYKSHNGMKVKFTPAD